ncbi:SUMF1/EgtB/PvdO family nonheme iron enzyme [uncultured Thiodictyon sp.]|uniref:SUMF1/EgtB/PvdO family nonheme iron enzyme n=1 Tax=uncultured Thiodictyon sp. TaxID=1846217 RepID=UPI0025F712ED|nr:SUMF1/EgtB/PvdO family nonheme iron enzyme [uncultured Thiodictyon sp.]
MRSRPPDIFISYSHRDGFDFAKELHAALIARGFFVFHDTTYLQPGERVREKLFECICSSRLYIPIITENFGDLDPKRWAYTEFKMALQEESRRTEKSLALKECPEPFIFPIVHGPKDIDDLKDYHDLHEQLKNRLCKRSTDLKKIVNEIVAAAGIVEDSFVDTSLNGVVAGRFPVTNVEYRRFINDGGYRNQGVEDWWSQTGREVWRSYVARRSHKYLWSKRTEDSVIDESLTGSNLRFNAFNQPVTGVCYFEAQAYCRWLTETKFKDSQYMVRLPTEAEWLSMLSKKQKEFLSNPERPSEKAINLLFSRQNELLPDKIDLELAAKIEYPSLFGQYPKSRSHIGCYDLIGNVWEWAHDFVTPYIALSKSRDEGNVGKILGNCCFDIPKRLQHPPRELRYPGYRHNVIGFRVVLVERRWWKRCVEKHEKGPVRLGNVA